MGPAPKDITGLRFHRLIALELVEVRKGKRDRVRLWRCRCDCGNEPTVTQRNLTAGDTKSCGCIIGKHKRTHGGTGTTEFRIWDSMRRRCSDPKHPSYPDYGGRGIRVCESWQDFATFRQDMGLRPSPNHSIDRIDNDGPYAPDNCRWATMVDQSNNRRSSRILTVNGETLTMAQWERRTGLKPGTVFKRLAQGWPPEQAVTQAPRKYRGQSA